MYYLSINDAGCKLEMRVRYLNKKCCEMSSIITTKHLEEYIKTEMSKKCDFSYKLKHIKGIKGIDEDSEVEMQINKHKIKILNKSKIVLSLHYHSNLSFYKEQDNEIKFSIHVTNHISSSTPLLASPSPTSSNQNSPIRKLNSPLSNRSHSNITSSRTRSQSENNIYTNITTPTINRRRDSFNSTKIVEDKDIYTFEAENSSYCQLVLIYLKLYNAKYSIDYINKYSSMNEDKIPLGYVTCLAMIDDALHYSEKV